MNYVGMDIHKLDSVVSVLEQNTAALRDLRRLGSRHAFVDDDVRLARGLPKRPPVTRYISSV